MVKNIAREIICHYLYIQIDLVFLHRKGIDPKKMRSIQKNSQSPKGAGYLINQM